MRAIYLVLVLVFLPLPSIQSNSSTWQAIETTTFNWTKHGPHTFVLESNSGNEPELRLRIKIKDKPDAIVSVPGGIIKLNGETMDQGLTADNLLHSAYLYLTPKLHDSAGRPMLILFGEAFASDPESLRILALDKNDSMIEVFKSDSFRLTALIDLDGDGRSEIVGQHCFSQRWGTCFLTYDPYSVYRIQTGTSLKASLSLALTKSYNLKHYYGWAGPDCSEEIAVVQCAPKGEPRVMSAKRAKHLYDKSGNPTAR